MNFTQRSVASIASEDRSDHVFMAPVKLVKGPEDMPKWDRSQAYFEYLGFIYVINDSLKSVANADGSYKPSDEIDLIVNLLNTLDKWIDKYPRVQQTGRYGNPAFKSWYNKLKEESINLLQGALPERLFRAVPEIMVYLEESFGNTNNLTYGPENEIAFIMFLCCLFKIGFLTEDDKKPLVCKVFARYLDLTRKLQQTYKLDIMDVIKILGAWSLDNYFIAAFLWGSSQLIDSNIEPKHILDPKVAARYADDYLFMGCLNYINKIKSGALYEYSNQLWSVSGISCWAKINQGIIKMYKTLYLGNFDIVKYIVYGSLFTLSQNDYGSSIRRPITCAVKLPVRPVPTDSVAVLFNIQDSDVHSSGSSENNSEKVPNDQAKESSENQSPKVSVEDIKEDSFEVL